ncbi:hypothetical protein GE21DRAFT_2022 [Neurospora crassa]|uniref:Class E vacuolar protein-sorting machinery protein HSE1 n=1 Tax=Neurospora crassa (strain ATCC 24698 / 74-OR23-1A / CBS 708.71 / DSM 1257 / FGSC 987) TaxID=367110 RepID=Q7SHV8_NEUCR|nr:SH3 domain-containing protein [Neurospora crassa OR74A]EAA36600.1 SH3 domain-containing protein [Neurospora crassa OR74A]KHE89759.1 hypothetical protein GE21DRAFT_2022 [Neurospora crassa]|eukprot:XP_965836.1 SH3 domain-containing protein [Neurospora crassa OR74A]
MVSVDRQRIIETNRSLRLIKNELESLLEKGIITDDAFDSITSLLPAEASLSSTSSTPVPAPRAAPAHAAAAAAPAAQPHATTTGGAVSSIAARFQQNPAPAVTSAANAFSNLSLNNNNPSPAPTPAAAPPSYSQSTNSTTVPPLPGRSQPPTPAVAPPTKPVIAHCKALYKYDASDARDCSFDKGDKIQVYEYMNADWWMGRCVRTGQEGIFPKSYVEVEAAPVQSTNAWEGPHNEKSGGYPGAEGYGAGGPGYGQPAGMYGGGGYVAPPPGPPPAGQGQVYDPNAPPQGEKEENKFEKHGKSIGKKFGNAAVFGAGATMGANLVNSIF